MIGRESDAGSRSGLTQAFDKEVGRFAETLVKPRCRHQFERRQACRHRHGIARQRASLVDGAERRQALHDVAPAAERADRHAAADDLSECGQVGANVVQGLGAAAGDAKSGHDFIENQQRAGTIAFLAQSLEEARSGQHAVHVAGDRLHDHAGDLLADLAECFAHLVRIVVSERDRVLRERLRHTRRGRHAEGQCARAGLDQQRVGVTVVAALELHDGLAPREAARQADRAHRRFGARAHESDQFDRRYEFDDAFGEFGFELGGRAEG